MTYLDDRDEIMDSSYARTVQHCLIESERGHTPAHVIESVGLTFRKSKPVWEDALMAVAHKIRQASNDAPKIPPSFSGVCLRCHSKYKGPFKDDKVCLNCQDEASRVVVQLEALRK